MHVGYGKVDISPELGIQGRVGITHFLNVPGDPVAVQALYFSQGMGEVLQLTADVVGITGETLEAIRERVSRVTGIASDQIIISATHTHASPWVWTQQAREARKLGIEFLDEDWFNHFLKAFEDAARDAKASARETLLKVGTAEVERVASNRLEYGWRSSWTEDPEKRAQPVGSIDPQVRVLALCDPEGRVRTVVTNYACHPTAFGGGEVPFASPDYPFFAERRLSRKLGYPVSLIYWMGCAGDVNTGKFCAEGSDEEVAGFGVRLGDAVLEALEHAEVLEGPLEVHREKHAFAVGDWMSTLEVAKKDFLEKGAPLVERLQAEDSLVYEDYHEWRMALKHLDFCQNLVEGKMPVELIRFRIGPLAILFVPGEWFHRIGLSLAPCRPQVAEQVPGAWITTLADFDLNYIPDPESFPRHEWYGVSPRIRILSDEGIRDMIEASRDLLKRE